MADAIKTIPAVKDIKNGVEDTISGPAIIFNVEQAVAARTGFTPQEVEIDTSAIIEGEPATVPIVANDRPYTLRVRFPEETRASLDAIRNTLLVSGSGQVATVGTLATVDQAAGQLEIRRENLQRYVAVTARLEGMSLGAGMQAVQKQVAALHLPGSIRVVYGGLYAEQQQSFHDLLFVLGAAVALVFIVLLVEFGGFAAPAAILSSALLSTSGVFFALFVTGTTFNLSSFMGLIMVVGIVAKNGILLLDADQKYRADGLGPREAMIGSRRTTAATHSDDSAGGDSGHDSSFARVGRRLANAATAGDCSHWRNPGKHGFVTSSYTSSLFLSDAALSFSRIDPYL